MKKSSYNLEFWAIIILTITCGLALRLWPLYIKPLMADENWTLYFAKNYSWQELLFHAPIKKDIHPGLYYIFIKLLLKSLPKISQLRIVSSLVPQILSLSLLLIWAVKHKVKPTIVLFCTIFLCLSPFLIHYSWQLRMYSLIFLWASLLIIFYLNYINNNYRALYLMIPIFILFHATHMSGYFNTLAITSAVVLNSLKNKNLIKTLKQHRKWLAGVLFSFIVTGIFLYPFNLDQKLSHASWVPQPSFPDVLTVFPLSVLGLSYQLNLHTNYSNLETIINILLVIFLFIKIFSYLHRNSANKHKSISIIILIFAFPLAGLIYSFASHWIISLPLIYRLSKVIPPLSIFIPRTFFAQAIFLHILMAIIFAKDFRSRKTITKYIAVASLFMFLVIWTAVYKKINTISATERNFEIDRQATVKKASNNTSIFFPEYNALNLINPQYQIPQKITNNTFTLSENFENYIKNNQTFSCISVLPNVDLKDFTVIVTKNTPSFYNQYKDILNNFLNKQCISTNSNSFANIFTCRCQ